MAAGNQAFGREHEKRIGGVRRGGGYANRFRLAGVTPHRSGRGAGPRGLARELSCIWRPAWRGSRSPDRPGSGRGQSGRRSSPRGRSAWRDSRPVAWRSFSFRAAGRGEAETVDRGMLPRASSVSTIASHAADVPASSVSGLAGRPAGAVGVRWCPCRSLRYVPARCKSATFLRRDVGV